MALAFTDRNKKVVLHSWGRFRAPVYAAVVTGDLLGLKTGTTYSMQLADSTGGVGAIAVAVQDIAAGETGWCALAAELKAPTSIGTGGVVTQQYFDDGTDVDIGQNLYLKLAGKCDETQGTLIQRVGYNMTRDTILLVPGGSITGAAGSFTSLAASTTLGVSGVATLANATDATSKTAAGTIVSGGLAVNLKANIGSDTAVGGALTVTGTTTLTGVLTSANATNATSSTAAGTIVSGGLAVAAKINVGSDAAVGGNATIAGTLTQTGVATFTAKPVLNGGLTVTAGQFISGAPIKMPITSKNDDATLTAAEAGIILVTVDNKTMTLPTAVGNAGLRYIIKQTAVKTNGTTIDGNSTETIDGDQHPCCGAQYDFLDIVSNGTNWDVIGKFGTWS